MKSLRLHKELLAELTRVELAEVGGQAAVTGGCTQYCTYTCVNVSDGSCVCTDIARAVCG